MEMKFFDRWDWKKNRQLFKSRLEQQKKVGRDQTTVVFKGEMLLSDKRVLISRNPNNILNHRDHQPFIALYDLFFIICCLTFSFSLFLE